MHLLAGDVGGTKTLLALYEARGDALVELARERCASADHESLDAVVDGFVARHGATIDAAAFAVAGPVVEDVCDTTNLPWHIEARALATRLGAPVRLLNDFTAVAHGIDALAPTDLCILQQGVVDPMGPRVILGAGTGLGEAVAVPTTAGLRVLESEGGHADFAPRNDDEQRLLRFLTPRRGRVSVEDVVSGPGLVALHRFVVEQGLAPSEPGTEAALAKDDAAAVIAERGLAGQDAACERALSMFLSAYGAEAGNLALRVVPSGGLYVAGGIAPKVLEAMRRGVFLEAFGDKAPMKPLLARVRVSVVMQPDVGLLGARAQAAVIYSTLQD